MASGTRYEEDNYSPTYDSLQACLHYNTSETNNNVSASGYGGVGGNFGGTINYLYHSLGYKTSSTNEISKANSENHSFSHSGDSGSHEHYNGTVSQNFTKTHNAYNVYLYSYCRVNSLNGSYGDSQAEYHFTVPALAQYTITYNTNTVDNVSSMPSNQTKGYGEDLSLSSSIPIRGDGSIGEFIGGDSNQNATTPTYPVNQTNTYTANNKITLYAIGKLKGHGITYNTQGGTPIPAPYLKTIGTTAYITSVIPQKEGYKFKEGNGNSDGTSTTKFNPTSNDTNTYPLKTYSLDNDLNLYAIGEKNDSKLKVKNGNKGISVTAKDFDALTYDQLNTKIDNGLVPAGDGHPNCAGATDANGNPGGYAYASMFLPELGADVYPTNYDGSHGVGTIFLQKFGKIVFMTLNYLKTTSGGPSDFYSDQGYGQTPLIIPEEFRPLYKVHIPELLRVEQQGALSVCAAEDEHAGGIGGHSLASSGQTLSATTFGDTFMGLTPDDSEGD